MQPSVKTIQNFFVFPILLFRPISYKLILVALRIYCLMNWFFFKTNKISSISRILRASFWFRLVVYPPFYAGRYGTNRNMVGRQYWSAVHGHCWRERNIAKDVIREKATCRTYKFKNLSIATLLLVHLHCTISPDLPSQVLPPIPRTYSYLPVGR